MKLKARFRKAVVALATFTAANCFAQSTGISDNRIKDKIIAESIASYPGVCACPFNTMRNGRACGGRSAWSRQGGYSPICYKDEVTRDMVDAWREANPS